MIEETIQIQLKPEIEKIVREEAKDFLKDIRKRTRNVLEKSLLSLLGLEKRSSSEYEIDHCNGRNSVLIDLIRSQAKEEMLKIVERFKISKEKMPLIGKAFEDEFYRELEYEVERIAKEKAQIKAKEIADEIIAKL